MSRPACSLFSRGVWAAPLVRRSAVVLLCLLALRAGRAQSGPAAADTASAEITSRQPETTFKVKVNLVTVRVVVRNAAGHALGNLHQQDFELLDNGKPQVISKFSVEQPAHPPIITEDGAQVEEAAAAGTGANGAVPVAVPNRYTALLFDDIHLELGDIMRVRDAAARYVDSLPGTDRAAVFSTSGRTMLDFTDDRAQIHDALLHLQPHPVSGAPETRPCPDVTYYVADQIQNHNDDRMVQAATEDAIACAFYNDQKMARSAQALVYGAVAHQLSLGDHETHLALGTLEDVVRRMTAMPGQRNIVLVSPGFLTPDDGRFTADIIDRATRSSVIISALDGRGLYTVDIGGGITASAPPTAFVGGVMGQARLDAASAQSQVMEDLAEGTGGTFFHNSNDLFGGLQRVAAPPEYDYLLAFTPQALKYDGRFHTLKVKLNLRGDYRVQARRGYYAPKKAADPNDQAKQDIEDALFSQEVLRHLPVELHTQFFKPADDQAKLAVLAHLDVKRLHFEKREGRNCNEFTVVSGVFDRNGRFLQAVEKVLTMRLLDDTLQHRLESGVTMKSSFDVKPGSYLVRLVVRDAAGQISAETDAVEIP